MRCKFWSVILTGILGFGLNAQTLQGVVTDAETGNALVMVAVSAPNGRGTTTDVDGNYQLDLPPDTVLVSFSYIGYQTQSHVLILKAGETKTLNIALKPSNQVLQTVVVSAGKYTQRVEETTISLEVIKPNLLKEKNTVRIEDAFNQTPGVVITDKQANIRSGSGWSFGTGSRVQMLVDDMPLLSPDAGQIQWLLLPMEAVSQIEVVKAAASVLYGTSAMNGLINVRTVSPKSEPLTEVTAFGGFWDAPKRASLKWWTGVQPHSGFTFLHSRKIKNADFTLSGLFNQDAHYRWEERESVNRVSMKTQFYPQKIKGLTWGVNGALLYSETGDALLWIDYEHAYIPRDSSATRSTGWDYYLDPFVMYRKGKNLHTLRSRIMGINNNARSEATNYENYNTYYYAQYQYQHFFSNDFWITAGALGALGYSDSEVFSGYHETQNSALFAQIDKKYRKLALSAGMRYEAFMLDERTFAKPVFRAGANYQLAKATFLRASVGQGFRFPSMAEAFTATQVGTTGVYPNTEIDAESGWTSELGIKQGFMLGKNWKGFLDVAGFINHFDNMIEFTFGFWGNSPNLLENIGFKSLNVGPTQIAGAEITLTGQGKIGPVALRVLAGYTYSKPIALEPNRVYASYNNLSETVPVSYAETSSNATGNILKYRYQHLARVDVQAEYKNWGLGASMRYNDFMQNIDAIFEESLGTFSFFPGVAEARNTLSKGDLVLDARLFYQINKTWRITLLVDNANNREYSPRPAQLGPPRKFSLQVFYCF